MRKEKEPVETKMEEASDDFVRWWNPSRQDSESGADIGGHPDAYRIWARKDPGRWMRRNFGTTARVAWNTLSYREEYETWVQVGRPPRDDFKSLAAPLERQQQFWKELRAQIGQIGKEVPEPWPLDYDPEGVGGA